MFCQSGLKSVRVCVGYDGRGVLDLMMTNACLGMTVDADRIEKWSGLIQAVSKTGLIFPHFEL